MLPFLQNLMVLFEKKIKLMIDRFSSFFLLNIENWVEKMIHEKKNRGKAI